MARAGLAGYWDKKRKKSMDIKLSGQCLIEIKVTSLQHSIRGSIGRIIVHKEQKRIYVTCPANPRFNQGARELSGQWRPKSGVWSFAINTKPLLIEFCNLTFGEPNVTVKGEK